VCAEITPANVNDITVAKAMPIKPGATYVFRSRLLRLQLVGRASWRCWIVTRLKVNSPLSAVVENRVPKGSAILSDCIGHLPARQARNRWIKRTLKIRRFLGTSENAIRIQIAVALIAYLLLRMAYGLQHSLKSRLTFTRLVAHNLMHRRSLDRLLEPPPPLIKQHRQLCLCLCQN